MSSQHQIDANRANGARSHGPKTPQGLARCRAARLKHGLDSPHILLPRESKKKFETLRNSYIDELKPDTPLELDCVDRMAAATWRLHRIWRMEVDLIDVEAQTNKPKIKAEYDSCDKPAEHALAFQSLNDRTDTLALLHRKEAHFHNTVDRALRTLERLRKLRLTEGPNSCDPPPRGTGLLVGQALPPADAPQPKVAEGPNFPGRSAPPFEAAPQRPDAAMSSHKDRPNAPVMLAAEVFIRRLLLYVLAAAFERIRHFGVHRTVASAAGRAICPCRMRLRRPADASSSGARNATRTHWRTAPVESIRKPAPR